jgi:hypothetical protein|nr:hypothetical protein [Xanthomonas massiliensis]
MSIRFHFNRFGPLLEPRKPRHPLVRLAAGLLGLAILAVMVFVGVFVGAAMILVGVAWKLFSQYRRRPSAPVDPRVVDAEYEIVRKPALPHLP